MESGNSILRQDDLFAMQSVIVEFPYGLEELDALHILESELSEIVEQKELGMLDGHEVAMDNSHGFLFLYGKKCRGPVQRHSSPASAVRLDAGSSGASPLWTHRYR